MHKKKIRKEEIMKLNLPFKALPAFCLADLAWDGHSRLLSGLLEQLAELPPIDLKEEVRLRFSETSKAFGWRVFGS